MSCDTATCWARRLAMGFVLTAVPALFAALPALPDAVGLVADFPVLSRAACLAFFGFAAVASSLTDPDEDGLCMSMSFAAHDPLNPVNRACSIGQQAPIDQRAIRTTINSRGEGHAARKRPSRYVGVISKGTILVDRRRRWAAWRCDARGKWSKSGSTSRTSTTRTLRAP